MWNAYECHFETKSISFINLPYNKIINYCHAFKTTTSTTTKHQPNTTIITPVITTVQQPSRIWNFARFLLRGKSRDINWTILKFFFEEQRHSSIHPSAHPSSFICHILYAYVKNSRKHCLRQTENKDKWRKFYAG